MPPEFDSSKLPPGVLFMHAFNHAPIGMALVAPDGRWLRVNRSICRLTGYTAAELMERRFQDVTHPDDLAEDEHNVARLLRGEASTYQMEKRYFRKDGSILWAALSVSLVSDEVGQPLLFVSQIQDITERKTAGEKLSAAAKEIERLRKGLLKVCAWTKRIEVDGRWLPIEDFLSQCLHLRLTHGMSEEAVRLFGKSKPH